MIRNKKVVFILIATVAVAIALTAVRLNSKPSEETVKTISPVMDSIQHVITSTASVQPQKRLEIKPPINGRIEEILVKEGDNVKAGERLAIMSSTERAALLDAAKTQGPEVIKYWEEVYKPTPLLSPIDGEVIVSKDYPGQTVTSADVVIVLSDHLIVQAQVDETDIGKIKLGDEASITLDAYPQVKIKGKVDHIYHESLIVNNVTIYQVDILPEDLPSVFRSGMSATITIVERVKDNVLTLPVGAVKRDDKGTHVLIDRGSGQRPEERRIEAGASDDKNVEILSGLSAGDKVLLATKKYKLSSEKTGTSPLNPFPRKKK